jgi:hypothetical protein
MMRRLLSGEFSTSSDAGRVPRTTRRDASDARGKCNTEVEATLPRLCGSLMGAAAVVSGREGH